MKRTLTGAVCEGLYLVKGCLFLKLERVLGGGGGRNNDGSQPSFPIPLHLLGKR